MKDLGVRKVIVEDVIDGDTFEGTIILLDRIKLEGERFRLLGVNTPEKGMNGYKEATEYTTKMILGKEVDCQFHGKDVFGRWLVTVYLHDDTTLNNHLIEERLALIYKPGQWRKLGYKK